MRAPGASLIARLCYPAVRYDRADSGPTAVKSSLIASCAHSVARRRFEIGDARGTPILPSDLEHDHTPLRALELFCGIGGFAMAVQGVAEIVAALDVSALALSAYRANFDHPAHALGLETVPAARLAATNADLWWLSPPCQPFTRRGLGRDDEDPRSRSLLALLAHIESIRPPYLALENVPGFAGSRTHERLRAMLDRAGYRVAERLLCPSELGVPMRRRRFYLVASRQEALEPWPEQKPAPRPLRSFVDARFDHDPALAVEPSLQRAYEDALDIVDRNDPATICACFTSAYGRSPVRSGSYLRLPGGGLRRFHPREILALLGFPEPYALPEGLDLSRAWRLVGNSLSVDAVRLVLGALPTMG